jgi:hypothetical protein
MTAELDYDLDPHQWEALKALRVPIPQGSGSTRFVIESLVSLELAELKSGCAVVTSKGRSVLLRGSPRLLDLVS